MKTVFLILYACFVCGSIVTLLAICELIRETVNFLGKPFGWKYLSSKERETNHRKSEGDCSHHSCYQ